MTSRVRLTGRRDKKEVKGNIEAMPHWAGEGVSNVKSILPATKIVRQLADEAEKLLHRWT